MKLDNTYVTKTITIKRRIIPDERLVNFIRYNSSRRHSIWNQFVEEYKRCKESGDSLDLIKFTTKINDQEIKTVKDAVHNGNDNIALMYCSDIPKSVFNDMKLALKALRTINKKKERDAKLNNTRVKYSELHYKKFDPFHRSFKVRSSNSISEITNSPNGKVFFTDPSHLVFRASTHYSTNTFNVVLKEPVCDEYKKHKRNFITYINKYSSRERYTFSHSDIKEIGFIEDLHKFYIILVCEVTYCNYRDELSNRKKISGIDLGIRNPICKYNGKSTTIERFSLNELIKLKYYERKCARLKRAMDHKFAINKANVDIDNSWPLYSRNYRKLQYRYRKYCKKASNIRLNWRNKMSHLITTNYKHIVVDEFTTPEIQDDCGMSKGVIRHINAYNRQYGMFLFMCMLRHMAIKNSCEYIVAPQFTTRTCSSCRHTNPKLSISDKIFICEKCGATLDRDDNAARNCYDAFKHKGLWSFD